MISLTVNINLKFDDAKKMTEKHKTFQVDEQQTKDNEKRIHAPTPDDVVATVLPSLLKLFPYGSIDKIDFPLTKEKEIFATTEKEILESTKIKEKSMERNDDGKTQKFSKQPLPYSPDFSFFHETLDGNEDEKKCEPFLAVVKTLRQEAIEFKTNDYRKLLPNLKTMFEDFNDSEDRCQCETMNHKYTVCCVFIHNFRKSSIFSVSTFSACGESGVEKYYILGYLFVRNQYPLVIIELLTCPRVIKVYSETIVTPNLMKEMNLTFRSQDSFSFHTIRQVWTKFNEVFKPQHSVFKFLPPGKSSYCEFNYVKNLELMLQKSKQRKLREDTIERQLTCLHYLTSVMKLFSVMPVVSKRHFSKRDFREFQSRMSCVPRVSMSLPWAK
jgi:hypothetical protein